MKKLIIFIGFLCINASLLLAQSGNNSTPTNIQTTDIEENSALLSWNDNPSAIGWIVSYNVSLSSEVFTIYTTDTNLQIINLVPGTEYLWRVCSIDTNQDTSNWTSYASFYTLGYSSNCSDVEALVVADMSNSGLRAQWQTSDTSVSSYEVVLDDIGANPNNGARHTTANQEYLFSNLTPYATYQIAVRNHCLNSLSNWSYLYAKYLNDSSIMSLPIQVNFEDTTMNHHIGLISSPNNPWVIGNGENSDPSSLGKSLYISNNNGISASYNTSRPAISYAYVDFTIPSDAVSFYIDFKYKASLNNNDGMRVFLLSNQSALSIDSLPSSLYQVGNTIYNNTNNSWQQIHIELPVAYVGSTRRLLFAWKNDSTNTTNNSSICLDNLYLTARYCAIPDSLRAYSISTTSAFLAWNMTSNQQNYNIQYKTLNDTTWTTVLNQENNYLLYGLTPNTTYLFRIQANCINEESFYSNIDTFTTHILVPKPTNLAATPTNNSALISWDNQTQASKWIIAYKENYYSASWQTDTAFFNYKTLNNLTQNTEYLLHIKTISTTNDTSQWSDTLIFSTLCTPISSYPYTVSGIIDYNTQNGFINIPTCFLGQTDTMTSVYFSLSSLSNPVLTFDYLSNTSVNVFVLSSNSNSYSPITSLPTSSSFSSKTISLNNFLDQDYIRLVFVVTQIHDSNAIFRLRNFTINSSCAAPANISMDSNSLSSISLSWSNNTGASSWLIKIKDENNNLLDTFISSLPFHTFSPLDSSSTYIFTIYSYCFNEQSLDSASIYASTLGASNVSCSSPTGFSAYWFQTKGEETIVATWDSVEDVHSWQVLYKNFYAMAWDSVVVNINPIFTLRNLDIGQTFCIKVRAICSIGDSSSFTNIDTVHVGQSAIENITDNSKNISIYPNPTSNIVYINSDNLDIKDITLTNTMGQIIEKFVSMPKQINLSSKEKGIYFLNYTISNIRYYKKIILQ